MVGLPKSLIKKYGISKKAWSVYRGRKRKKTSTHKRTSRIKRRKSRPMVKRRKTARRSRTNKIFGLNVTKMLAAALYGAGSARISQMLAPLTLRLPFGAISDEVGKYTALELSKRFLLKRAGVLRDAATIGQHIEMARVGEAIASGSVNLGFLGGGQANNGNSGNLF